MLSHNQLAHYRTFGYVILRGYLNPQEVATVADESLRALIDGHRDHPFDGKKRHWTPMLRADAPFMSSLLEDPRFFDVAEQLLGKSLPFWCDANRYVDPVTGWHPDTSGGVEFPGVKFFIYLQPLTSATGALRVIPGSHQLPWYQEVRSYLSSSAAPLTKDVPAVACETQPGDVIAFNFNIFHAACGGAIDRRMCTLAYFPYPDSSQHRQELVEHLRSHIPASREAYAFRGDIFPGSWIDAERTNRRRAVVVERLRSSGILDLVEGELGVGAPASRRS